MNWIRSFLFVALAAAVASCASAPPQAAPREITILIGVDGFRPDYLDRGHSPALLSLAQAGVRGQIEPSFPSVTFPNHYTLITGLRPDRHGLINNRMEDPERPGVVFTLADRAVASDPIWWEGGLPLWVSAERAGVRTGTMFWPGSEWEIGGGRPSQYRDFDQSLPGFSRVDILLSWLDLPEAERPRFLTLYFDIVDTAGHRYGPDSLETNGAIAETDAAIARLIAGLNARGYQGRVNFVVVSDHGMAAVSDDRLIDLDASITREQARVVWDGPFAGIAPLPGHEAAVEAALVGRSAHGECWRKGELPARFHFGTHRRVPGVICLADIGWRYRTSQRGQYAAGGAHGFDPAAPEMAAIFIGSGPAFREGAAIAPFEAVSIYPLLAHLIGVTPEPNDGTLNATAPALAAGADN
ncbi:MAG TPA: ectonucleotide pyrophosphatase/phosphodiesterase [Terricaulis sp.]|nr:ectonucleotide pyrophosphatase/phosphodiesterase [Terricaulis sp.]